MTEKSLLGRNETAEDVCTLSQVRKLAALLDRDPFAVRDGDPLAFGWHVCLFTSVARQSALGPDGTPEGDSLLPAPAGFSRRVAGGRRITYAGVVGIGSNVRRTSEVVAADLKSGRSGNLLVTTVRHEIFAGASAAPAIIEEYDTIFREAAATAAKTESAAPAKEQARRQPKASKVVTFDSRQLFRYSAVMYNAHRIHYDRPFATEVEGYPDLVVNGSLTVLALLEFAREQAGFAPLKMTSRNMMPLYAGGKVTLCLDLDGPDKLLWAETEAGQTAVELTFS